MSSATRKKTDELAKTNAIYRIAMSRLAREVSMVECSGRVQAR